MKKTLLRFIKFIVGFNLILFVIYLLGPRYDFEKINAIPLDSKLELHEINEIVRSNESQLTNIKPDNHEQIVWFDSIAKTEYVILYLHGFSSSHGEGDPIHKNIAKQFGCNLLLSRLPGHGLVGDDVMLAATASAQVNHAKELINMASQMGDHLIIMCTSTGATLASYLATTDKRIKALIMMAPNFAIPNKAFDLIDGPWGYELGEKIAGGKYWNMKVPTELGQEEKIRQYWSCKYRIESLLELDYLVSNAMLDDNFSKIEIPYFLGYYYRDDDHKDEIISVKRIKEFDALTKTATNRKKVFSCGRCSTHVLGSPLWDPEWEVVQSQIADFMTKMISEAWLN